MLGRSFGCGGPSFAVGRVRAIRVCHRWPEPAAAHPPVAAPAVALAGSGVRPGEVDRVFLTGGSSFVPAVRRIFATRFGEDRIQTGNEFTSVAHGLSLRARESQ